MNLPPTSISDINTFLALTATISAILFGSLLWRLSKIFGSKEQVTDHETRIRDLEKRVARISDTK